MNFTDIFSAAKEGTVDDMRYFVEQNKSAIYMTDNNDWTPLHYVVAQNSNVEVLKYLISQGANVNAKNKATEAMTDLTPLHIAAYKGDVEIAKILISAGANINIRTDAGLTPLHTAVMEGNIEVVKILILAGADVNAESNLDETPLHTAIMAENVEIAKILISAGANINVKSEIVPTPINFAKYKGNKAMIKYLTDIEQKLIKKTEKARLAEKQRAKMGLIFCVVGEVGIAILAALLLQNFSVIIPFVVIFFQRRHGDFGAGWEDIWFFIKILGAIGYIIAFIKIFLFDPLPIIMMLLACISAIKFPLFKFLDKYRYL